MKNQNLILWEEIFANNEWGKYPALSVIKFIARSFYKVPNRKEIKILEIGSGTGANLWFCAREGFSVIALEGSQSAINTMKKRFEEERIDSNVLKYSCGDYYKTLDEIENNSLNAIIDMESLYCNSFYYSRKNHRKVF
ncbi:class I SAM-dependent methyltransferase [Suttonella sp. R2A3]|uniref:class I SAM-dependent methyltransferase n=1 Tax=Suttonella sp. R2A3 TaxID=2908648 RepID=UPI001F44C267|nr:class I SAM-dependent methyltransferase [Suttonella sp. R2A3]UJF25329.1 class I SAM-dependent methyltransferase [Suttonella sp. R2A3]